MEGLFGGTQAPSTYQGQDDVLGLGTGGNQQVQPIAQTGDLHSQQLFGQQPQITGQLPPQVSIQQAQAQQVSALQAPAPAAQTLTQMQLQSQLQPQSQQSLTQMQIPQTRDQILSEMMKIGQQIGKRVDPEKVNSLSDYDLQQQYFEALNEAQQPEQLQQSQQLQQANQLQPQEPENLSEIERLQKQNEEMGKLLAQLMGMNQQQSFPKNPQYGQQMPQLPGQYQQSQNGQFMSPQQFQQMQNLQQTQPQLQLPQLNSEEFYAKLEENPSRAIAEITTPLVEQALTQQAQQFQSYLQQMREQQQREQQIQQFYSQQIDYLKQTHPDFDQYRHVAAQVLNERPHYAMMENGLVYAYEEAKQRVQAYNQQQLQYRQPMHQQQILQKQVAALPGTVNYFQEPQPQNPFGTITRKGIFG